jgi:hypothetical protein
MRMPLNRHFLRKNRIYPGLCNRNLMKSGYPWYAREIRPMGPHFSKNEMVKCEDQAKDGLKRAEIYLRISRDFKPWI